MRLTLFMAALLAASLAALPAMARPCARSEATARIAVVSAFEPEWVALRGMVKGEKTCTLNGVDFVTGTIEHKPVVLFLSGVSMVNAAMNTQAALDHFNIRRLVFSGIAGGADPALSPGDVTVPARWGEYLETSFARETPEGYKPVSFISGADFGHFDMMFPHGVKVVSAKAAPATRFWFDVDPAMLDTARKAAAEVKLHHCLSQAQCLSRKPQIVAGGAGVSGPAFVDNAKFRQYVFDNFHAQVMDMETAALAHVAFANSRPYIAFRSLSDLAGGGDGPNQMHIFMGLASSNSAELVRLFLKLSPKLDR
jgi:adenosylhomocysteine nucleosidase